MTTPDTASRDKDQKVLAEQVQDLRAEGDDLYELLNSMDNSYWTQPTSFKNWSVWDVIAHLHFSDYMALTCLRSASDFESLKQGISKARTLGEFTNQWLMQGLEQPLIGPELLQRWRAMFIEMCEQLATADPSERFVWFGPGMRARMFTTARQMETWAHGWEIYDLLGTPRRHTDRIRNIATIGVRTFGWTFVNRKLEVPADVPHVRLTAPSGAIWEFNDSQASNRVSGDSVEFCQVVTQVRNIADTALEVTGESASRWMAIAQCFAGAPSDPPAPGTRQSS